MAPRQRLILLCSASAQFMSVASATIVAVALPTIGRDLHAGSATLEWVVDAYVLAYASLMVGAGVFGDRYGRKQLFLLGLAVFGLGSLLDGLAPSGGFLVAARALQGIGPAIVVPNSLALLTQTFPDPADRAAAVGLWSASSGVGIAVGPVIGGLLVDGLGWQSVFLVGVPVSLAILALAWKVLPGSERTASALRFDVGGAVLVTIGLAVLVFAIIESQSRGWGSIVVLGSCAIAVVLLVTFVRYELLLAGPLIDVRLFARPAFSVANLSGLVVFFAFIGSIVYFSAFFQSVQHRSPTVAGLCVLPMGAGLACAAPLSGRLVGRIGPKPPMVLGLALCGLGALGVVMVLSADSSMLALSPLFVALGAGAGLCLTPMTATAIASVEASRAGMASAVHNAMRQIGQALGVAVLGSLVYGATTFVHGLHRALGVSAWALLVTAFAAWRLVP